MTGEIIHLIVREDRGGRDFYATSPQAPGFLYGRPSLGELRAELQEALEFHFEEPGPYAVQEHHERHYDIGDGEVVIRTAVDGHADARRATREALGRAIISDPAQAAGLVSAPATELGEVVYICGVMSDTIGWVMQQLDPRGDIANVAVSVADVMIVTVPFAHGRMAVDDETATIASKAYTLETKLSEVVRDLKIVTPTATLRTGICA
ncbi:hypothetical protein AB0M95_39765 [Sphaerisporangium sp. NPDC051017]|uniref:hypothetical protein n=1 Tax=Sphaerisporangium sp. NPDC051017 TaxID=3154636 RepID=UPI003448A1A5